VATSLAPQDVTASPVRRVGAAIAGALILLFCSSFTLGTVVAAPLGVLAALGLARRRRRPLTRGHAWVGALIVATIAVPLVFAGLFASAPPGTIAAVRAAMDSAQTEQKPADLPAWLERMAPPGAVRQQNAVAEKLTGSTGFMVVVAITGAISLTALFGTIAGSLGWGASMLFAYAISGRWLPRGSGRRVVARPDE
jgi:4-amino-4-deoxy-L-arabinose transferase-like glycosyltransferase